MKNKTNDIDFPLSGCIWGTLSATPVGGVKSLPLEELAFLAKTLEERAKALPAEMRGNKDALAYVLSLFPTVRRFEGMRYYSDLAGLPVYEDPTIPKDEIRILNSEGKCIQVFKVESPEETTWPKRNSRD